MTLEEIVMWGWPVAAVIFMAIFVKKMILDDEDFKNNRVNKEEFALMVFTTIMVGMFSVIWPVWIVVGLGYLGFNKLYDTYSKSFDKKQETKY